MMCKMTDNFSFVTLVTRSRDLHKKTTIKLYILPHGGVKQLNCKHWQAVLFSISFHFIAVENLLSLRKPFCNYIFKFSKLQTRKQNTIFHLKRVSLSMKWYTTFYICTIFLVLTVFLSLKIFIPYFVAFFVFSGIELSNKSLKKSSET